MDALDGPMRESPRVTERRGLADATSAPSMFGRELSEQADADKMAVPVIVTKSISAVEAVGMLLLVIGSRLISA